MRCTYVMLVPRDVGPAGPARGVYVVTVGDFPKLKKLIVSVARIGDEVTVGYILNYSDRVRDGIDICYSPLKLCVGEEGIVAESFLDTVQEIFKRGIVLGEACEEGG